MKRKTFDAEAGEQRPCSGSEDKGSEKLGNLPKVTKLVCDHTRI